MKKSIKVLAVICLNITVFCIVFFGCTPKGREVWNTYWHGVQKSDDLTLYQTRKDVEDTCRSMQASYESDKLIWMQFKDDENPEHKSWADSAMMRANKTASEYNNFILKNKYVWRDNVPSDIYMTMDYLIPGDKDGLD